MLTSNDQHKTMKAFNDCFVALGSNLGDSEKTLNKAIQSLAEHKQISNLTVSKVYKSKPHGPQDQPDYLNGAVYFQTRLEAEKLLDVLQNIENNNGRDRENSQRWGARTLDLDILFYNDEMINTERLTVPHPRICERAFVLLPLLDLMQKLGRNLNFNEKTSIQDCMGRLPQSELDNIQETSLCPNA